MATTPGSHITHVSPLLPLHTCLTIQFPLCCNSDNTMCHVQPQWPCTPGTQQDSVEPYLSVKPAQTVAISTQQVQTWCQLCASETLSVTHVKRKLCSCSTPLFLAPQDPNRCSALLVDTLPVLCISSTPGHMLLSASAS
jgi:hypothetical protein